MDWLNETPVSLVLTKNIVFHAGNVGGHHTLQWSDRRFTYVLVSNQQGVTH